MDDLFFQGTIMMGTIMMEGGQYLQVLHNLYNMLNGLTPTYDGYITIAHVCTSRTSVVFSKT